MASRAESVARSLEAQHVLHSINDAPSHNLGLAIKAAKPRIGPKVTSAMQWLRTDANDAKHNWADLRKTQTKNKVVEKGHDNSYSDPLGLSQETPSCAAAMSFYDISNCIDSSTQTVDSSVPQRTTVASSCDAESQTDLQSNAVIDIGMQTDASAENFKLVLERGTLVHEAAMAAFQVAEQDLDTLHKKLDDALDLSISDTGLTGSLDSSLGLFTDDSDSWLQAARLDAELVDKKLRQLDDMMHVVEGHSSCQNDSCQRSLQAAQAANYEVEHIVPLQRSRETFWQVLPKCKLKLRRPNSGSANNPYLLIFRRKSMSSAPTGQTSL